MSKEDNENSFYYINGYNTDTYTLIWKEHDIIKSRSNLSWEGVFEASNNIYGWRMIIKGFIVKELQ